MNSTEQIDTVYTINNIKQQIEYLHACAGYPTKQSWLAAVLKGYYKTWPIINEQNISKYLVELITTLRGHMNQACQNVRSMKAMYEHNK